ncbi:MAG: ExeM/NucH family extracellular endonuclease [Ilumatobacteraceae bacterium]
MSTAPFVLERALRCRRPLRHIAIAIGVTAATALPVALSASPPTALAADIGGMVFSEYIEGSSNNKALEIYNGTGSAVNLATSGYAVLMYFNGSPVSTLSIGLTGTVGAGDVYVLAQSSASAAILAQADQSSAAGWFNGDDAVVLTTGGAVVDSIGQVGFDPGTEWGTGLTSTADNTLRRRPAACAGDTITTDVFDPAVAWVGFETDTFDGLGAFTASCDAPFVTAVSPAAGATGVARDTNINLSFNEPVTAGAGAFGLSCTTSGAVALTVSGGPLDFVLDPVSTLAASQTCTVTVVASLVTDLDEPVAPMAADFTSTFSTVETAICGDPATKIHAIQGTGLTTPLAGVHSIEGVIVGDYQGPGQFAGFHVQEEDADVDALATTSEGIFVFNSSFVVNLGDLVRVTGTVGEFGGMTQISSVSRVLVCATAATVTPSGVDLPVAAVTDLERYEGMSVAFVDELTVTETFTLGRFGELTLSAGGRQYTPTAVVEPGAAAAALQDFNNRSRIVLDDALNTQNPPVVIYPSGGLSATNTVRSGDTVAALTGVLEARFGVYRVQPTPAGVVIQETNPRPASPDDVGGRTQVASFNVLNYFNGEGLGGGFPTPRGATTAVEFARQRAKIVSAIVALDADVVGLMEIENDATPNSAIEDLVAGLNAATAPGRYAFINTGVIGTDAIRVALIYQPAHVTPVGSFDVLTTAEDPEFIDTLNRPPLAQTFADSFGDRFTVVVNHLKSKGSNCNAIGDPDMGDGQGNCNVTRTRAARAIARWLATDPTGSGDPDVLIIGDLNSYTMEDPIKAFESAGYLNLIRAENGLGAYSYVFCGQSGYLDHGLANGSLAPQVTGVTEWHINADEPIVLDYNAEFKSATQVGSFYAPDPYRSSDHDPVLVGLCPAPTLAVSVTPNLLLVPNHRYVRINVTPDGSDDVQLIELVSVVSNEADDGVDDGNTVNDIVIDGPFSVRVRAERSGVGSGRVYTFTYRATNDCGATVLSTASVTVPVGTR